MAQTGSPAIRISEAPWPEALVAPIRQILRPEMFVSGSLAGDLSRLSSPGEPLTPQALLSLTVKYFHAYVLGGSHEEEVSLSEITRLFLSFSQYRTGRTEALPRELVMKFTAWNVALRRLGDLPRTAALFRAIAEGRPEEGGNDNFVGLDLGTGAGLFLVAQWLQARRRGVRKPMLWGLEADPQVGRRTQALMAELEMAEVLVADPKNPEVYEFLRGMPVSYVSNETIPVVFKLQGSDEFLEIHQALFAALGAELASARFFPEMLRVDNMRHGVSLDLHPGNRFQVTGKHGETPLFPRALEYDGKLEPLELVGNSFEEYIPPRCLHLLPRRW